ncbi:MAG: flagellar motor protein MotB [Phycisphaerae bacterium]
MALKKKDPPAPMGAPDWMVTYGDMVTLLLTFFVLLLAMSEVKEEENFLEFMQAVKEAFGYVGGVKSMPLEDVEMPRNIDFTEMLMIPVDAHNFSRSKQKGVRGKEDQVTSIRRGEQFDVGGKIFFEPLSHALTDDAVIQVKDFAEKMRGYTTQIQVRGHCSKQPVAGTPYDDHFDLAFARAAAIKDALIREGIEAQRVLLVSAGINEPFTRAVYTDAERRLNDVVEVLQVDVRVDEFEAPEALGTVPPDNLSSLTGD